ncbi:MAG: class I SAM-dependent methyltransferase [Gomphosphaeria aponina SAG 52.96 = DSM 107014]|uniref:Class I SAM-dependent methyltransferase n=1 Tax=Gomphosphaeria aponina SAG 52.96 = DSM 107014 TaxID=1521640 RepID=A0A941GMW9_9CHRO|nr:class I SAM-dependent methyltransferase [Gomphosphaeria aponina SAG 52.96 = DSM 107014]
MLFDEPYYISINEARWTVAEKVLNELKVKHNLALSSCLDVGCGPGWFAEKLVNWGVKVTGIDGRLELVEAARNRVANASFELVDVESKTAMSSLSKADLVFAFGLLYHTENPFRVIRNLHSLTEKVLLIESQIIPGDNPITWLVEEGKNETQGLTHHALIPSRSCLLKMLQVAGFAYVYEYLGKVDHEDFIETETKYGRRGIFLAAHEKLQGQDLVECPQITTPKYEFHKS